jgi:hypothetical protein
MASVLLYRHTAASSLLFGKTTMPRKKDQPIAASWIDGLTNFYRQHQIIDKSPVYLNSDDTVNKDDKTVDTHGSS